MESERGSSSIRGLVAVAFVMVTCVLLYGFAWLVTTIFERRGVDLGFVIQEIEIWMALL